MAHDPAGPPGSTIHLQYFGQVEAKPASQFKVGAMIRRAAWAALVCIIAVGNVTICEGAVPHERIADKGFATDPVSIHIGLPSQFQRALGGFIPRRIGEPNQGHGEGCKNKMRRVGVMQSAFASDNWDVSPSPHNHSNRRWMFFPLGGISLWVGLCLIWSVHTNPLKEAICGFSGCALIVFALICMCVAVSL